MTGLRLSGGELRSRMIHSPRGAAIRPTPGRAREALFSIVAARLNGAQFLDLYAGTGAVGLEAISRGAEHATFVELHAPTAQALRRTAAELGVEARTTILCAPAEKAAHRLSGPFDLVYADPPYAAPPPLLTLTTLRERRAIGPDTTVVYERRVGAPGFSAPGFVTAREANYGETVLQFLRVEP